jgi:hypothetical protein
MDSDAVKTRTEEIRTSLRQLGLPSFTLTDSSTWYREKFSTLGDWDAWIWETVNGKDYGTRKAHFDGFVIPNPTMGRANAQIAALALRHDRLVLGWREDGTLVSVKSIVCDNANDWTDGWSYQAVEVGG